MITKFFHGLFLTSCLLLFLPNEGQAQYKKIRGTWDLHQMIQFGDTLYDRETMDLNYMIDEHLKVLKADRGTDTISDADSAFLAQSIVQRYELIQKIYIEFAKDSIYYNTFGKVGNKMKANGGKYWLNEDRSILYMSEESKNKLQAWEIVLSKNELQMTFKEQMMTFVMKRRKKS